MYDEKCSDEKYSQVLHVARLASGKDSAQTDDRISRTRYKREDQGHSALHWLQMKSKTRQRSLACKFCRSQYMCALGYSSTNSVC